MAIFSGYSAGVKVGMIVPFSGTQVPDGFLICDGSAISRTLYSDLFAAIGTTYGSGDGSTTFNLPNGSLRLLDDFVMVQGNGKALGLQGNNGSGGMCSGGGGGGNTPFYFNNSYPNVGTDPSGVVGISFGNGTAVGITTVGKNSGLVANMTSKELLLIIRYEE